MSIVPQNIIMREVSSSLLNKGTPHISNRVFLYVQNWLGLVGFIPQNKQPIVPYKQGPTVPTFQGINTLQYNLPNVIYQIWSELHNNIGTNSKDITDALTPIQ